MSSECWIGFHDYCMVPKWCECLCHAELDELMKELEDYDNP